MGRRRRLSSRASLCPGRRNTECQCDDNSDNSKDRLHGAFLPDFGDYRHVVCPMMIARGSAMPIGEGKIAKLESNADNVTFLTHPHLRDGNRRWEFDDN